MANGDKPTAKDANDAVDPKNGTDHAAATNKLQLEGNPPPAEKAKGSDATKPVPMDQVTDEKQFRARVEEQIEKGQS